MKRKLSLDEFIVLLARKIDILYSNNCADEEDYIQAGHLKLAEISGNRRKQRDFRGYAIIAIARAMRKAALDATGAASATGRVKRKAHSTELLLAASKTENEICRELKISAMALADLKSLINTESWHRLFDEPANPTEPFSLMDDLLSSSHLTEEDKTLLQAQFDSDIDSLRLTRRQRWLQFKNIRHKLTRSGYGPETS
ncbi:hypothetical protein LCGC14_0221720 [marine sediment metagenome]|uniref:Uncharacterized protein n=1 Tax=marine sediment metagenome TaxID=412755 RepID=A0A0F9UI41_9ZZZZ